jgi:hypothetical protein
VADGNLVVFTGGDLGPVGGVQSGVDTQRAKGGLKSAVRASSWPRLVILTRPAHLPEVRT